MTDETRLAELADQVHDMILVDGWCQGTTHLDGARCLHGACYDTIKAIHPNNGYEFYLWLDMLEDAIVKTINPRAWSKCRIPEFNDDPATTVDDVLDLVRKTSKRLRET